MNTLYEKRYRSNASQIQNLVHKNYRLSRSNSTIKQQDSLSCVRIEGNGHYW